MTTLTLVDNSSYVSFQTSASPLKLNNPLVFCQERCLFWSVWQEPHAEQTHDNGGYAFNDEQEPPIRDGSMGMLNTKCNKTTEGTSNSSEAEPVSHSSSHFMFGVPEC